MRLTRTERHAIAEAARATWGDGARVRLFGSRTDDTARGGDIDLLVASPGTTSAADWVAQRSAFMARLYAQIGERRIDVLLDDEAGGVPAEVVASARRQAVPLGAE